MPETAKKLADTIKINHKSFIHSLKFGQADFNGLGSIDAEKRKAILKEPLQLAEYTKLEKIGSEKNKKIKKEVERVETSISMLGDPAVDIQAADAELQFCQSTIQSREETVEKLVETIVNKQTSLDDVKKSLNTSDCEVHDKIAVLTKRSKELKANVEKSNEQVQRSDIIISDNNSAIAVLQAAKNEASSTQQELVQKPIREKTLIQTALEKVSADELYGTKLLAKLEAEYDYVNKNVPTENVCPACLQEITTAHRKKCETESTKVLEEKSEQIRATKSNLTKCINKKKKLQVELKEAILHEKSLQDAVQKQENAQSQIIIRLKQVKDAEIQLVQANHSMQLASTELTEVNSTLNNLKKIANSSNVAEINKKIFEITDEIKVYERSLQNVRSELSTAQNRQGAAVERLKRANENSSKLVELKNELISNRKLLKIAQLGINGFSPSGIPTLIIHTILDEFQSQSNYWLGKLRPELRIELNADVEMSYRVDDKLRDWDQLSIGQKVYITLALKLGLSKVIQQKLGIDIRFLLLDEVEASLDDAGIEAYCDILKKLEPDFKIFVISHNQSVKEKLHTTIMVEGDGSNGSQARVISN